MRVPSASEIKRNSKTYRSPYPKEGTKARKLYDFFAANKGLVVDFKLHTLGVTRALYDLQDFYGCDIRRVKSGKWIFAGEWINGKYISYFEP